MIEEAADWGADMLITHHPMIFKAMKKINDEDFIGRRVLKLIRDDISYYAMHTNYDVMGMAELAGKVLELSEPEVLEVTGSMHSESGEVPVGIGRVADLAQPMDLKSCAEWIKKAFDLPNDEIFGEPDMQVHRLGVFPGSGKSAISVSLEKGVDVLVTGDIDHHEGIDAVAQKMAVIDAGHMAWSISLLQIWNIFAGRNFQRQRSGQQRSGSILGFDVRCLGAGRKQTDLSKRRKAERRR